MKKMNSKGFTLIELLAVITIMGILMMVAIPAVSRTIENSRRDTFASVAQSYLNAVRNAVIADELTCDGKNVSATPTGVYYFEIDTEEGSGHDAHQQTIDIMESGGKSSWGAADVHGYVVWKKTYSDATSTSSAKTNFEYYIDLRDKGEHGTKNYERDQEITRAKITASGASTLSGPTDSKASYSIIAASGSPTECTLK